MLQYARLNASFVHDLASYDHFVIEPSDTIDQSDDSVSGTVANRIMNAADDFITIELLPGTYRFESKIGGVDEMPSSISIVGHGDSTVLHSIYGETIFEFHADEVLFKSIKLTSDSPDASKPCIKVSQNSYGRPRNTQFYRVTTESNSSIYVYMDYYDGYLSDEPKTNVRCCKLHATVGTCFHYEVPRSNTPDGLMIEGNIFFAEDAAERAINIELDPGYGIDVDSLFHGNFFISSGSSILYTADFDLSGAGANDETLICGNMFIHEGNLPDTSYLCRILKSKGLVGDNLFYVGSNFSYQVYIQTGVRFDGNGIFGGTIKTTTGNEVAVYATVDGGDILNTVYSATNLTHQRLCNYYNDIEDISDSW